MPIDARRCSASKFSRRCFGIDYNAIIQKYTRPRRWREVPYQNHLNQLNKPTPRSLKIQSCWARSKIRSRRLEARDVPGLPGDAEHGGLVTAVQVRSECRHRTTTITKQTAATSTQIVNDAAANATYTAAQYATATPTLANLGASVTPSNGTLASGLPAATGAAHDQRRQDQPRRQR